MSKIITIATFMILLIISLPLIHANELNLVYDNAGNLKKGDGFYREYNSLNQLSKVYEGNDTSGQLLQEFIYDLVEERVFIKIDHTKNETTYYWNERAVTVHNSSGVYNTTYVYQDGLLVAQIDHDSDKTEYIHSDNIGSASIITDENGDIVENITYSPFGQVLTQNVQSRYSYEAKEYDEVTGDTDFHFRKYDPDLHIFTQPDSLIQNQFDPQSLNRYAFERNNPLKNIDPDGHLVVTTTVVTIFMIGYVIGVASEAYRLTKSGEHISDLALASNLFKSGLKGGSKLLFFTGLLSALNVYAPAVVAGTYEILWEIHQTIQDADLASTSKTLESSYDDDYAYNSIERESTNIFGNDNHYPRSVMLGYQNNQNMCQYVKPEVTTETEVVSNDNRGYSTSSGSNGNWKWFKNLNYVLDIWDEIEW